jgi:Peptidase A4 family
VEAVNARARLAAAALAVALAIGLAASGSATAAGQVRTLRSPNWSGYVAEACGTCKLRYVAAAWTLPAVNCAKSPPIAWAEAWVGLDGIISGSVEQAGTASLCTNGQPSYFAWYQMYPDRPVLFLGVSPGDLITASVFYDAAANRWQLALADRGRPVIAASQPCPAVIECGNVSAEVIMEAPNAGADVPLADFGTVAFTSIRVTSRNGTRGGMASNRLWTVYPVDLVRGVTLAVPGPVRAGTSFTDTWLAAQ